MKLAGVFLKIKYGKCGKALFNMSAKKKANKQESNMFSLTSLK